MMPATPAAASTHSNTYSPRAACLTGVVFVMNAFIIVLLLTGWMLPS